MLTGPPPKFHGTRDILTMEVKVPLVGGQLESFMGRQMAEATPAMLRFTAKWITEHA